MPDFEDAQREQGVAAAGDADLPVPDAQARAGVALEPGAQARAAGVEREPGARARVAGVEQGPGAEVRVAGAPALGLAARVAGLLVGSGR